MTRRLYNLEPRDATGVFLGMSTAELVLFGGGFILAVVARLAGFPVLACAVILAAGFGAAKIRVSGQPLHEWLPLLAGWALSGGRRGWTAGLPLFPSDTVGDLPPALSGLEVVDVPGAGRRYAAVCDRRAGRATVVLTVEGGQFAGQDAGAQDALLASWGDVLASAATPGSPTIQLGWSDATTPADLADHHAWADRQLADTERAVGDPDGYRALVDELSGVATAHETVVWLTVSGSRLGGGRGKPLDRALAHVPSAVDDLVAVLMSGGLRTDGPVPAAGVWRLLRARIDPAAVATRRASDGRSLAERLGLVGPANGGPVAVSTAWSQMRMDGSFHRTWWVEAWPRRAMPGDWLQGFLTAGESRAMTVAYRPVDPEQSRRRIKSQMNKHAANRAVKAERDRRVTTEDQLAEDAVGDLEGELAAGYAEMLYLGLVTVAAPTIEQLDDAGRRVEQAARAQGMSLRVLHGRQDIAWAGTLPFGLVEPSVLDLVGL